MDNQIVSKSQTRRSNWYGRTARFALLILLSISSLLPAATPAFAASLTINTTGDGADVTPGNGICETANGNGICTLRAAIQEANALAGADTISFNILTPGPYVITPLSTLPTITDSTVIDGYTQPGASANTLAVGNDAVIQIGLDGGGCACQGLQFVNVSAGAVRGLAIYGGFNDTLVIESSSGVTVAGNFIGLQPNGTASGAISSGIYIDNSNNNLIGGTTPAARNVVSANQYGVNITAGAANAVGNVVQGNYIGTNPAGTTAIPNTNTGVLVITFGALVNNTTIGGTTPGARNVVSGNGEGISLWGGTAIVTNPGVTNTVIKGNYIGVASDGVSVLPNNSTYGGIVIRNWASNTTIGAAAAGEGNLIANNPIGVTMFTGYQNAIVGNSIYNNTGLGIDLGLVGANDAGDGDDSLTNVSLANNGQNYPVISAATITGGNLSIDYSLDSLVSNSAYPVAIDFYEADSAASGEGRVYLGRRTIAGPGSFNANLGNAATLGVSTNDPIVATATDANGNTSLFSPVVLTTGGSDYVVNSTLDSPDAVPGNGSCQTAILGECTLRAAIMEANAQPGGQTIAFNIPGTGPHTIKPLSAFPAITSSISINGLTQPGASCASWPPTLQIEIDGSSTTNTILLDYFSAGGNTIRGLVIHSFFGAIELANSSNNVIECNFLGTDVNGTLAKGNTSSGIIIQQASSNNRIGGPLVSQRNLISANGAQIEIDNFGSKPFSNIIQNNYIGTDVTGSRGLGTSASETIFIYGSDTNSIISNLIYSTGNVTVNTKGGIAISGDIGRRSLGNIIQGNVIGIAADGITATGSVAPAINLYPSDSNSASIAGTVIGGSGPGQSNLLSGNTGEGIYAFADSSTIQGNLIGTQANGIAALGNQANGITINGNTNVIGGIGVGQGNVIANNTGSAVSILSGSGNIIRGNRMSNNGGLGIDLGGDGVSFNHAGNIAGPNVYQNYPVLTLATSNGSTTRVAGTLNSTPGTSFIIDVYANPTCDPTSFGEGRTELGSFLAGTDNSGLATFDQVLGAGATEPQGISVTATGPSGTSEFSYCRPVSTTNLNWVQAQSVSNDSTTTQYITDRVQEKWFKFAVQPGDKMRVTLTGLPGSAISLHTDPNPIYNGLTNPQNAAVLSAEAADTAFLPSGSLPSGSLPSGSLPSGSLPSGSLPSGSLPTGFLPSGSLPSGSLPSGSLPSGSLPSGSLPSGSLPSGSLPSGSLPSGSLPSGSLPSGSLDAYSSAARRSLMGTSMDPYATVQTIERNTYDLQENLYVRVIGPYNLATPFSLDVTVFDGVCGALQAVPSSLSVIAGTALAPSTKSSLILTHSGRLPGTPAEVTTALADLQRLAVRTDVNGVVIDLADAKYQRVAWANTQADQFPACPTAKNTVAREIKAVIDAYRAANTASGATTLKYIVLAGGASVIPFFQVQDVAGLANEKEYVAPVAPSTPSEAGLRAGLVQGQDAYGSQINLSRGDHTLAIPDLAVGRLVDSASDISIAINAYIATNGVVVPQSALVTGYDFVGDAAAAIKVETDAGTRSQSDSLIQPVGEPPTGPNAWTADQLRTKLLSGNFDIAVLSGHFSAGNLLAADYTTKLTAEEIANSTANLTNVIILALGCHGGYSIPSSDLLTGASPNPDWAKAFLRKGAAGFVAATGYAYGDTELTEYGERLFVGIAQQLRTGSGPISLGQALVAAKRQYLAQTAQLTGIDEKTVIEMALYGLPMMKVDMPGTRLNPSVETPIVNSTSPATTGPGANTGLSSTVTTLAPTVVTNTKPLVNLSNNTTVTTTYLSGADGVVANPYEPIYPKDLYNVSIPNRVLRGVAFRGGVYSDRTGIIPLTSAPATETSSAHLAFTTDVFYPNQTWLPNFYDAFSGGLTRLIVIPAQYQSRAPGTIDGTLRTFNNLNLQLYYLPSDWAAPTSSATVKSAAVSAAPTILGASAEENNGIVTFSVNAQADGSADVQSIWVLYTGKLGSTYHGQWLPLDLTRSASDTTLWTGTLALQSGANAQDLQFMVQAVGGAGLTTLATNLGAYYSVTSAGTVVPTPIATTLALQSPPTAGIYLKDSSFSLILTAANQPLAGKNVTLDIGGQQAQATTDANGRATITLKPVLTPGSYTVQASFRGSADYIGSTASSAFILNKDSTTVTVTPTSATITLGQSTPIVAVVRDSANQALGGKSVFFVLHNTSQTLVRSVISDYLGNAALGAVPLPIGIYTVDVYFNGTIPTGGSQPLILSDDYYASSNRLGSALTIANVSDTTPPTITAAATTAPNANGWYKTSVTVRFTCADAGSGIASGSCPADQTLSAEGSAVSSTARTVADVAGNISAPSNIVTVKIDKTAPTSTGSVTINGNQATVTLSASDSLSGVASTSYRINNGTQQTYSAPFVISTTGTYVVTYFSTDRAGNAEAAKTLTFTVLSILDTFNRANGGVGSNWDGTTGTAAYKIASNRLDVQLGGPIYWKTAFGKSQEAFVRLSTIDTGSREQGVLLKVQTSSVKMAGGIAVVYDAKARAVRVETLRVNSLTWTLYANQAVTFNNGDRLGARALADGTIQIYKNGVLVATVTLNAADKTFFNSKGGNIGLWMVDAANGLVDDFGGGTLAP